MQARIATRSLPGTRITEIHRQPPYASIMKEINWKRRRQAGKDEYNTRG